MDVESQPERKLHPTLSSTNDEVNLLHIFPQQGQIYHMSGPGRAGSKMRPIAEYWVAVLLAQGETVHWVDGACRIDPSRLLPVLRSLGADTESCLSRLYLSRGFTLHQLDGQISRLRHEVAITHSPFVILDGILAMHEDDAIRQHESRALLRRHLNVLKHLAEHLQVAIVLITESHSRNLQQQQRIECIQRHSQHHLSGFWHGQRRKKMLHLHHHESGVQGQWHMLPDAHQLHFVVSKKERERHPISASLGVFALFDERK